MANGPGKYDNECTLVRELTGADAALLVILNGDRGAGFAVQSACGPLALHTLCDVLEATLVQIRRDLSEPT